MKKIIKSPISLLIAIVGLIGGLLWMIQSNYQIEPIILLSISALEILGFFFTKGSDVSAPIVTNNAQKLKSEQNLNVQINIGNRADDVKSEASEIRKIDRDAIIELMMPKTNILFIDDDKNFNVVKILKSAGYKKTKSVVDISTLDLTIVKEADIIFVDINGVGKLLNLEHQGLDLALMLKQKYPNKKVGIYSANKTSNSFHEAWGTCDFKVEKNALPYQFQNLVENYSVEAYNRSK